MGAGLEREGPPRCRCVQQPAPFAVCSFLIDQHNACSHVACRHARPPLRLHRRCGSLHLQVPHLRLRASTFSSPARLELTYCSIERARSAAAPNTRRTDGFAGKVGCRGQERRKAARYGRLGRRVRGDPLYSPLACEGLTISLPADLRRLRLYSAKSLQPLAVVSHHRSSIQALDFAPLEPESKGFLAGEDDDTDSDEEGGLAGRGRAKAWVATGGQEAKVSLWEVYPPTR